MPIIKVEYTTSPTRGEVVRIKVVYKQEEDGAALAQVMQIEEALQKPAAGEGAEKGLGLSPITTKDSKDGEYYYLIDCGPAQHNEVQEYLSALLSTAISAAPATFVSQHTVAPVPKFVGALVTKQLKAREEHGLVEQQKKLEEALSYAKQINPLFAVKIENDKVILQLPKFHTVGTSAQQTFSLAAEFQNKFRSSITKAIIEAGTNPGFIECKFTLQAGMSAPEKIRAARKILEFANLQYQKANPEFQAAQQARLDEANASARRTNENFKVSIQDGKLILVMPKFPQELSPKIRGELTTRLNRALAEQLGFGTVTLTEDTTLRTNTFSCKFPDESDIKRSSDIAIRVLQFSIEQYQKYIAEQQAAATPASTTPAFAARAAQQTSAPNPEPAPAAEAVAKAKTKKGWMPKLW